MSVTAGLQFDLQLMGGFCLRHPDHLSDAIAVSSKKARALLAYVAMQEPMQVSRERLAALLWPERVDRQARQNLRACLASLRADLASFADDFLTIDGDTVGLKNVGVDARRLNRAGGAVAATDSDAAAALYRGPFLADMALDGEDFCAWALAERVRLDAEAGSALAKLISRPDDYGDGERSVALASRLVAIDPFREDWLRLSLQASARHVGRDKALLQARSFVAMLRKELDVEPEAETLALIEWIKAGDGIAAVAGDSPAAAAGDRRALPSAAVEQIAAHRSRWPAVRGGHSMRMLAAAAALVLVSLAALYAPGVRNGLSRSGAVADDPSIRLLLSPFQAPQSEAAGFARDLTEAVLTSVSRFSGLTVIDGRSLASSPPAAGVGYWAQGSVSRQGSSLRVHIDLTDTADRTVVWAADYAGDDAGDDLALSRRIARDIQVQATYAAARGLDDTGLKPAPLNRLIAGALSLQYRNPAPGEDAAATFYEETLRRDPHSAPARIGLAARLVESSTNLLSERRAALGRAEQLIQQALQIDPRIERAYYWLGIIHMQRGHHDLALRAFDRALELNPSFVPAEAHAGFALVLLGRADDGLRRIKQALRESAHDPNERLWLRFAGIAQLELGDDREAIMSLREAASLGPPAPPLRAALASAYALAGEQTQSREQFQLLKRTADPTALAQLLVVAASHRDSRYWHGLRLAAGDTL